MSEWNWKEWKNKIMPSSSNNTTPTTSNYGAGAPTASASLFTSSEGKKLNQAKTEARNNLSKQYPDINWTNTFNNKLTTPTVDTTSDKGGGGGGGGYYSPTYASFTPSETYLNAINSANTLLEQLNSGRTSYTDKLNGILSQIENRPAFQYDFATDTMFQNSLQSAMASGQTAMQDTMGQASALTGGYGSTYATSAANQAYNSYIQDAYANLPDYYNMALDAYNSETSDLYNKYGLYQSADDTEYSRLLNSYQTNLASANDIYDKEYNNYWQTQNYNQGERQYAASMARQSASDAQSQANWEAEYALKLADSAKAQADAEAEASQPQYKVASNSSAVNAITSAFEKGYDEGIAMMRKYEAQLTDDDYDWFLQWASDNGIEPKLTWKEKREAKKNK